MGYFKKVFTFSILFLIAVNTGSCQKRDSNSLSVNEKDILTLYAHEHLFNEHEYLYHRSEKKEDLLNSLYPPLNLEDFRLPELAKLPNAKSLIDTLFSEKELDSWSHQISNYEQINWSKDLFSDDVKFLKENEIPEYLSHSDIPPPNEEPVFVHYLSIPFIYQKGKIKTALLYSKRWSSSANVKIRYHYFKKNGDNWKTVQEGPLNIGY